MRTYLKPTHKTRSGEKLCYVRLKFTVDVDRLELATMVLLDQNEPVNRKSVVRQVQKMLSLGGSDAFGTGSRDDDRFYQDNEELTKKAEKLVGELFPDFKNL